MRYKLAIFDMDGTILNTIEDLTTSLNFALKNMGYPEHTEDEVKFFVGNGLHKTVERAVPAGISEDDLERTFYIFKAHYEEHSEVATDAYPGITELLKTLRKAGVKTAVVSNKLDGVVKSLADKYFPNLFDIAIGQQEGLETKPSPDEVNLCLNTLKIYKEDAVYIGDSNVDVETAKNAKMDLIAVDWGFRSREFLLDLGVDTVVSSAYEIEKLVLTDLSSVKNIICPDCGAEFPDNRDRCPYCGNIYYPAAERAYMDHLNEIRDEVDDLSFIPGKETKREIKKTIKRLLIAMGIIVLILAVVEIISIIVMY